jgi:hypothetical protein
MLLEVSQQSFGGRLRGVSTGGLIFTVDDRSRPLFEKG